MAYMIGDRGPYPNKAGEYCGNHSRGSPPLREWNEDFAVTVRNHNVWLQTMRFGRPRPTTAYTIEQLEGMGMVGLYLKQDQSPMTDNATEIPTPPEMSEPPAA